MAPDPHCRSRGASTTRARLFAIAAFGLLSLAGCGGGGGSGGGDVTVPIAETAADYWVSGDVARWTYRLTDTRPNGAPRSQMKTVEDGGDVSIAGRTVRRFVHSASLFEPGPETEYRFFDGQSIRNVAPESIDGLVPAGADYAEVPGPLVEGLPRTVLDRSESEDVDGDGLPDTLRVVVTNTEAIEPSLSLPAGDFRDVLRVRTVITATLSVTGIAEPISASAVLTAWYAPRIGIVRRVYEDPEHAAPDNVVTEELIGFAVGALRGGVEPGLTLLDGLGAGTDSGTPGSNGIAFGAGRALVVSSTQGDGRPGTTVEGALLDAAGTPIWRGRLLETSAPYVLQDAAVGFDGQAFRVVAVRTIPYDSPTTYEVVAQRLSPDGRIASGPGGTVLETGVADASQSVGPLRVAGGAGRMMLAWGRYDATLVQVAPGLVMPRGRVGEARLFGASDEPLAAPLAFDTEVPIAISHHLGRYVIVTGATRSDPTGPTGPTGSTHTLAGWPVDENGMPAGVMQPIATSPYPLGEASLQPVDGTLWLSFQAAADAATTPQSPALRVARLDADAALVDGTPDAPGRVLAPASDPRGGGRLAIGASSSVLAWASGYDTLQSTRFGSTLLNGTAPLPSDSEPLLPADTTATRPSRSMLWAREADGVTWLGWLENEQNAATPSDRIRATLLHPRYVAP